MGNTLNTLNEFVRPKRNVHLYIKMEVRNLKTTGKTALGEFGSTAQWSTNAELLRTAHNTLNRAKCLDSGEGK